MYSRAKISKIPPNLLAMFLKKSYEIILWVKISKIYIPATKKFYIAGVYNSQKHSTSPKILTITVIDYTQIRGE